MALSAARNTVKLDHEVVPTTFSLPVAATTTIYQGGMVALDANGRAVPAAAGTGNVVGRAAETADNSAGGAGAISVEIEAGVFVWDNTASSISAANRGQLCYATDDESVQLTNAGGLPIAGVVFDVLTSPAGVAVMSSHALAAFASALAAASQQDVKESADLATAAALPAYTRSGNVITADANGALTVDGVGVVAGDRLLLKDGAAGADNGLYSVTQPGTAGTPYILTRSTDADSSSEVTSGMIVVIERGTANGDTAWQLTTNDLITLNTTALTFAQIPFGFGLVGAVANVTKAAAAAGTSNLAARIDHKHDVTTAAAGAIQIGDAAAEGAATSLARSDHTHSLAAPAAPVDVTKAAASAGAAVEAARADHKHDVSTATTVSQDGSAVGEGAATSLARSDHTHLITSRVQMFVETYTHADLTAGATTETLDFPKSGTDIPTGSKLLGWVGAQLDTPFSGGMAAAVTFDLGTAGDADSIIDGADLFAAAIDGQVANLPRGIASGRAFTAPTQLRIKFDSDVNVADLDAGQVVVRLAFAVPTTLA